MAKTDWSKAFEPLLKQYKGRPHPLEYKNNYQLLVMVILSARDSDRNINNMAPEFFKHFPDMSTLAQANEADLGRFLVKVRGGRNKAQWLMKTARAIKEDKNIPLTMEELVKYPGIGRKSANVIKREAGAKAEGVIVDLHVVRVAPRIGVANGTDPKKIEQQLMEAVPQKDWGEIGMAISHLGREICRPSHPEHHKCVMAPHCEYFKRNGSAATKKQETAPKPAERKSAAKQIKVKPATKASKGKPSTKTTKPKPTIKAAKSKTTVKTIKRKAGKK